MDYFGQLLVLLFVMGMIALVIPMVIGFAVAKASGKSTQTAWLYALIGLGLAIVMVQSRRFFVNKRPPESHDDTPVSH